MIKTTIEIVRLIKLDNFCCCNAFHSLSNFCSLGGALSWRNFNQKTVPVDKLEPLFKSKALLYVYDDHTFSYLRSTKNGSVLIYQCRSRRKTGCPAVFHIIKEEAHFHYFHKSNCKPDLKELSRLRMATEGRKRIKEKASCSGIELFKTLETKMKTSLLEKGLPLEEVAANVPKKQSMLREFRSLRNDRLPHDVSDRSMIKIPEHLAKLPGNSQFLFIDEHHPDRMIVFMDHQMCEHLPEVTQLAMDGTFFMCPKIFSQLYVIHCEIGDSFYPTFFCFMYDRTLDSYNLLFKCIKAKLLTYNIILNPSRIITDYENAAISALKNNFNPNMLEYESNHGDRWRGCL